MKVVLATAIAAVEAGPLVVVSTRHRQLTVTVTEPLAWPQAAGVGVAESVTGC